jgi:chemotaxis protein MotB
LLLPVVGLTAPTRVEQREMDRDEVLLRESLRALPRDSGVAIARESTRDASYVTLRIPAVLVFEPDTSTLTADAINCAPLLATLKLMQRRRTLSAQLIVYTDGIGETSVNQSFSDARANALAASLITAGIPALRLQSQGAGSANALGSNATPEGRSANRRIEIEFRRTKK